MAKVKRILFVVPPLAGHTLPTVALGEELRQRGHQVAWIGHAAAIGHLLPSPELLIPLQENESQSWLADVVVKSRGLRWAAAFQFLWQDFLIPLAVKTAPEVHKAVESFQPDVIVADQQALAGGLVARKLDLPWATSATTSAELANPFAAVPKFGEWVIEQLIALQEQQGISAELMNRGDLRFSEHLVLAYTTAALLSTEKDFPAHYAFVGPCIAHRSTVIDYPWEWLDSNRRHLLVSLGTVDRENNRKFLNTVLEAVQPLGDSTQVTIAAPPHLFSQTPEHVLVREYVPQLELLAKTDAVLCHAGQNTVSESLARGLPLIVAPIRDDQPIIAEQVTHAGAGRRVRFGRTSATELHSAITDVLSNSDYQVRAKQVQMSFEQAGGTARAADRVEGLL